MDIANEFNNFVATVGESIVKNIIRNKKNNLK